MPTPSIPNVTLPGQKPKSDPRLPKFPSIVPDGKGKAYKDRHPAEQKRMVHLQKEAFLDPKHLFVNISTANESADKIGNFLMELDQANGKGNNLAIHQPLGTNDTDFQNNRYGLRVKSIRDLLDKTIGVVPADLFRLAYLGHVTQRPLLDRTLGPNEGRFTQKPGEVVQTDDTQRGGRNVLTKDDVRRRTDAQYVRDVVKYLADNKVVVDDVPGAVRNEKGVLEGVEDAERLLPPKDGNGQEMPFDGTFLDLRGVIGFNSYMGICKKYLRDEFEPVLNYAVNVGKYAADAESEGVFSNSLLDRLGKASYFPMTHIGENADAPAQHIPMDTVFGDLGHVKGYDEARRCFFGGKTDYTGGVPAKASLLLNLDGQLRDTFVDSATGEATPQLREAIMMIDNHAKEVREKEASDVRGKSVESRKIVLITKKPLRNRNGQDMQPIPGIKDYEMPKPDQSLIVDVTIPEFIANVSRTIPFTDGTNVVQMINGDEPTNAAKVLAKKVAKFTSGFSYLALGEYLEWTVTNSKTAGKINISKFIETMKGSYTEQLFKSVSDAGGAQVKEQFEVVDIDQVKPENMRHPEQVAQFLENYKAASPLNNLLDDPAATKESIKALLTELGMDPETFGWSETKWNSLTAEDMKGVKQHIQKHLSETSTNFILFSGPGGMGKTTTAMYLAHMLDYGFMMWNMCRSKNKFVGDSEKGIDAGFNFVAGLRDYIILLDEVDHCLSSGGENDGGTSNNLIGVFKTKMENVIAPLAKKNNLIIISTTNHPDKLEGPIARRLGKDKAIHLDYVKDQAGLTMLADAAVDRYKSDPAFDRLQAMKQVYANALFREATNPSKTHKVRGEGGQEVDRRGAPYSNDEISRMFKAWIDYNRTVVLKKFGKAAMYKPESLTWVVEKSRRQSLNGSFDMAQIPDGIVSGTVPTHEAPQNIGVPGYTPVSPPNRPTPQGRPPVPPPPPSSPGRPNVGDANLDAANSMTEAKSKKPVKKAEVEKPKVKLMAIADSLHEQQMGLKGYRSIPTDSGMLFKYQSPKILSFWMQDTYIPLDIAFISSEGHVTSTARMVPMSTRPVRSNVPCVMALEVTAGTLERIGCTVGKKAVIDIANKTVHFE